MSPCRWRRFTVAAILACSLSASACGTSAPQVEVQGETERKAPGIVLDVAMFDGMGVTDLIRTWELEHPGVSVRFVGGPWLEQNHNVLNDFDDGPTPDIVTIDSEYTTAAYLAPDNFYDLRSFGADDLESQFLSWRWNHGVASTGEVVGIPTDVGGLAVAYRTDLFERAGLPTESDEVAELWPTWDDYMKVAKGYSRTDGQAFIASASWLFRGVVQQGSDGLGYTFDDDGTFRPAESLAKAWDVAVKTTKVAAGVSPFSTEALDGSDEAHQFATVVAPAWMTTFITTNAPAAEQTWGLTTAPGGSGNWGGSQLSIPARAEHPELAWDLIAFLSRPESQLSLFVDHGNFPSITALIDDPVVTDSTSAFFRDAPVGEIYSTAIKGVTAAPVGRWDTVIATTFQNALKEVERQGVPARTAYRRAIEHLTECLGSPSPSIERCA